MVSAKKVRKLLFIKCNNHLALHSVLETTTIGYTCCAYTFLVKVQCTCTVENLLEYQEIDLG